ncbi:hypothetical protein FOL47_010281 [Perkinsus chesapeaki]|uniref:Uncharacterized protein n=1 Tax=Perkinsus chesapeaki TaxID=330153 RepID=A0A7J6L3Q7_PERCH|nr:hypothetical protein FOL47_010281 [Perkinsus chesapeaki]
MLYIVVTFLVAQVFDTSAFKPGNIRMHLVTRTICNKDAKDVHGNPNPCGKSLAMETDGLTLPGMEDGSVTTREDMIVAKDGLVDVKAMPSRPYQFIMSVDGPKTKRVAQLFKNQDITLSETPQRSESVRLLGAANAPGSLAEDGWTHRGTTTMDGATVHKYTKRGPQGIDPNTKANYTALYQTGMYPDHWTFYTDSNDDKPVKLVGVNSFNLKTLQVTEFAIGKPSFFAEVEVKVTFNVNLPVIGSIINWSLWAKLSCTAAANNDITVYGAIGTDVAIDILGFGGGAGVSVDIEGRTLDNLPNKWEFFSGVNLNAWVNVLVYKNRWNWRWEIWHASPVYF